MSYVVEFVEDSYNSTAAQLSEYREYVQHELEHRYLINCGKPSYTTDIRLCDGRVTHRMVLETQDTVFSICADIGNNFLKLILWKI